MALDSSIHLGYASTDQQVNHWDVTQLVSVVAPLEKNPQMVMWDPEVYPDLSGIREIGERGIIVQVFAGGTFPDVFIAQGIWDAENVDKGYTGSPARFIADGDIAQQGFASAEPYQYEFVHTDYGRPVAFELLHDAGFEIYSQTIGVRNGDIESMRGCLERLVPIIQQASVDFSNSPGRANAIIIDAVETYDTWWTYSEGLAEFSVKAQRDFGLVGDGPDDIAGNMEASRYEKVFNDMVSAGMEGIDPDLTYDMLFTNEFIDPNISYGFGESSMASPLEEAVAAGLAGVCPSPLVVQTDWFPESEHGAMYELVGEGYSVDQNNGVVRGPMVLGRHGSGHRVGGPRGRSVPWGVVGV